MRPVVVSGSLEMASSPEAVWPLLTDTDRVNRLLGSEPVAFTPIDAKAEGRTAARFLADTRAGGFRIQYEEAPFEWSHGRTFSVTRTMRTGPLTSYSLKWALERGALEGGTRATVCLELVPRSWIIWPIAWMNARRFVAHLSAVASGIDAHVRDQAPSPYLKPVGEVHPEALALALEHCKRAGVDDEMSERLGAYVRDAPDADVVRIRPFELADRWGTDRRETLRAFLRAVSAGLVELRWGLICPSCMTASQQVHALAEISTEGHCQLCDISFELELDRAVEATFLPHHAVRPVPEQLFCIGGPARTPHVLSQANFAEASSQAMRAPSDVGRYRVFARGGAAATLEVESGGKSEAELSIDAGAVHPARLTVAPGASITVHNASGAPRHVKIEKLGFASQAATAHLVSTIGEFRTLFSSDLLKRSTPLKVARVAVLFSDLTGSTALYSKVGDAAAFRLVDDHFDLIRSIVDRLEGVVVKTMGDAVLATFADAGHCARAAVEMLAEFERFRAAHKHGDLVGIKLGMHAGACYVVTANGALDYFGQTVNVASRVQHLAGSGELVCMRELYDLLPESTRAKLVVREELSAVVKGVEEPLALVRVALAELLVPAAPPSTERLPSIAPQSIRRA
jgi:adenylate cyclase